MNQPYRPLGDLTSQELLRRAIQYRRMAMTAHGQATVSALDRLALRYALLAARREIDEASQRAQGLGRGDTTLMPLLVATSPRTLIETVRPLPQASLPVRQIVIANDQPTVSTTVRAPSSLTNTTKAMTI